MDARRDAGVGAASFVVRARELVVRDFHGCVATVGSLSLEPGAFNVIPGRARLALEFRALEPAQLDALEEALLGLARREAEAHGLALEIDPVGSWEPTPLDAGARAAIARAADTLGLSTIDLPSGAGHDAQALASVTRSGMIFVPSRGGVSHQGAEHTAWSDCVNGANVLLEAALDLARSTPK